MVIIEIFKKIIKDSYADNLYKNSFYLIAASMTVGVFGLLFWLIAAHLYSAENVGLAAALISVASLLVVFSTAGVNPTFIRWLSSLDLEEKSKLISTFILFSITISTILSVVFIIFIDFFAPKMGILKNFQYSFIFIITCIFSTLLLLFNGIFISKGRSIFVFIKNLIESSVKFVPLFFLVSIGEMGIIISSCIGMTVGIIYCLFLFKKLYPKFRILISIKTIKHHFSFTIANSISTIFLQLPNLLFPLIILNTLSASDVAYFFVPWQIFFVSFAILIFINIVFLSEASSNFDKNNYEKNKRNTIKLSFLVAILFVVFGFILGEFILNLFGKKYVEHSVDVFHVLLLSLFPITINQIYLTTKMIKKEVKEFTLLNIIIYSSILMIGTILIQYFGIIGVGYGWIVGQMLGVIWIGIKIFVSER